MSNDKELSLLKEETKTFIREICSQIKIKTQLRNPNNLIVEYKEEVVYRGKRDKDLQHTSVNSDYLRLAKNKYRENKAILDITVSDTNINRVYLILDTLIHAIEDMEGYIYTSECKV